MTATKLLLRALTAILTTTHETAIDLASLLAAIQQGYGPAYAKGGAGYVAELKHFKQVRELRKVVYRLQRTRYINARKIGTRLELTLTRKGYTVTLHEQLKNAPPLPKGVFTVVTFDIPFTQNRSRRRFRWFLRQGGFKKLQQSVWVTDHNVHTLLTKFIQEHKLQPWVNVFNGNNFLALPR